MSLRHVALVAVSGSFLACGGPSAERCQQWDASVREVVARVEEALPSGAARKPFPEHYRFVAEDLELAEGLAACVAAGHLAEASEPSGPDPAPDIAFVDGLAFGSDPASAAAVMEDLGWSCEAGKGGGGSGGQVQVCSGRYARGKAEVRLVFRSGALTRVQLAVHGIPKRIEDIVAKTGADVFAARKALIEKVVSDLGTRFPNLVKTEDELEDGRVRMVWTGSDDGRQARLEFSQKGPSLGFVIRDARLAREVAEAREQQPERRADSYFE